MREFKNMSFELKALKDRQFEGYGSIFGNVDYGGDVVIEGAFAKTLQDYKDRNEMPQMFWMHQWDKVPGKWLDMSEDSKGLYVKGQFVNTPLGDEIHELVQQKAVRGLSIGYETVERAYDKEGNRLLKELDLWEVSPVSLAMNPLAQVTAAKARLSRDFEYVPEIHEFKRKLEEHLRDVGCSKTVARTLVSRAFDPKFGAMPSEKDDDPGEMPDEGTEEFGMQQIVDSLKKVQDSAYSGALKR